MQKEDLRQRVPHFVLHASKLYRRYADARLQAFKISSASFPVLELLIDGKGLSQKELAARCHVEQSSMAVMLRRLERDGIITRTPDPRDGRSRLVTLSQEACAKLATVDAILQQGNTVSLQGLSSDEIKTLKTLLQRVIANLHTELGDNDAHPNRCSLQDNAL